MKRSQLNIFKYMIVLTLLTMVSGFVKAEDVNILINFDGTPRSNAYNNSAHHMYGGQTISDTFVITQAGNYDVIISYSNDGPADQIAIYVDDTLLDTYTTHAYSQGGQLWNQYYDVNVGSITLETGEHEIEVVVNSSDQWGYEHDTVTLTKN